MYDDDEEQEGVIQLYITCNEDLNVEDLQDISKYVKKIGGLFQVNKHEEEGNTKLELFFATARPELQDFEPYTTVNYT